MLPAALEDVAVGHAQRAMAVAQVTPPLTAVLVAVGAAQRAAAVASRPLELAVVGIALREDAPPLTLEQT